MVKSKLQTRDMVMTALCTAVIAVCTQLTIPMPSGVPITLQTFAVALCGFLLTPKFAELSVFVYLMLGAVGIPVFSALRGGFQMLLGPTGGFLYGFLPMALLCSLSKKKVPALAFGIAGLCACHFAGVLQYALLTHTSFLIAALKVSVPFLPKDIVSVIIAMLLAERLRPMLKLSQ